MTAWTDCHCPGDHATVRGFLRCKLPTYRLVGHIVGAHALIAWCGTAPTVSTHPTAEAADRRLHRLRRNQCCPDCRGAHEAVHIIN